MCAAALEASVIPLSSKEPTPERRARTVPRSATRPGRIRRDAGASAVEYGAVLLLIAAIMGAFVALALPSTIADNISYTLCKIFNNGDVGKCESPADKKFKPDSCTVALSQQTYGATVDIAFFQAGKDLTFIRTTDSHGKVTVTAVNGTSGGVGTGVGVGINWGNVVNVGADADAKANIKIGLGNSWVFDNQDQANKFIGQIQKQATYDGIEDSGPLGWLGGHIAEWISPADVPDPTIERYEVELNGNAGVSAGVSIGPKNKTPGTNGKDTRGSNKLKPNLGAYVTVEAQEKAIVEKNKSDGTTSVTVSVGGGGKAGGNYVIDNKEFRGAVAGSVKLTYDKSGSLSKLTLVRTTTLNGHLETTTTELPITNDEERLAVYQHLGQDYIGANGIPAATPLKLTWDDMAPVSPPGPDATPLQQLLYDKGKTQKVGYDYDAHSETYGANVKLGLKLGLGVNLASKDQKATSAQYLGAQGTDGNRQWKTFNECRS
jgi:Flp pilus assembly pilin Flp